MAQLAVHYLAPICPSLTNRFPMTVAAHWLIGLHARHLRSSCSFGQCAAGGELEICRRNRRLLPLYLQHRVRYIINSQLPDFRPNYRGERQDQISLLFTTLTFPMQVTSRSSTKQAMLQSKTQSVYSCIAIYIYI